MNFQNADFVTSYGDASQLPPPTAVEMVLAGRSNVGKSSLINRLCQRKNLARVSSTPGKTATINYYRVDGAFLVDLPGYGYAKVSDKDRQRWNDLIEGYFAHKHRIALLVLLLDIRRVPNADDESMLRYVRFHGLPCAIVLTKADKLKKSELEASVAAFASLQQKYGVNKILVTSSEKGTGFEELKACLEEHRARAEAGSGLQ